MYRLSEELDVTKLNDKIISQISFGLNCIVLISDNCSIQFSGPFLFKFDGKIFEREEVYPISSDFGLLNLLEKKIDKIYCNDERTTLTIEFGEDLFLILKSNDMFECFEIDIDGRREIV